MPSGFTEGVAGQDLQVVVRDAGRLARQFQPRLLEAGQVRVYLVLDVQILHCPDALLVERQGSLANNLRLQKGIWVCVGSVAVVDQVGERRSGVPPEGIYRALVDSEASLGVEGAKRFVPQDSIELTPSSAGC